MKTLFYKPILNNQIVKEEWKSDYIVVNVLAFYDQDYGLCGLRIELKNSINDICTLKSKNGSKVDFCFSDFLTQNGFDDHGIMMLSDYYDKNEFPFLAVKKYNSLVNWIKMRCMAGNFKEVNNG